MRVCRIVAIVLVCMSLQVLAPLPLSATEPPRLAVLDLLNPAGLDAQALEYLTDVLRAEASAAGGSRVQVITNESVLAMLPPGTDYATCTEADCEVEFGRRLGATFIVTGEVRDIGDGELRLTVRMHETEGGTLVGTGRAGGGSPGALIEEAEAESAGWFREWLGGSPLLGGAPSAAVASVGLLEVQPIEPLIVEVYVDGASAGTSNAGQIRLSPGTYAVELRATGYAPRTEQVTVRSNDVSTIRNVRLMPLPARLLVRSNIALASVSVDGVEVGVTPIDGALEVEVSASARELVVARDGYETWRTPLQLTAGERREFVAELSTALSALVVSTPAAGLVVYVNGEAIGLTDDRRDLRHVTGPGEYVVRIEGESFHPEERRVTLSPGAEEVLVFHPSAIEVRPATLSVRSTVRAEAYVNGTSIGFTPVSVEVAPGEYLVSVARAGYTGELQRVTVTAGQLYSVSFRPTVVAQTQSPSSGSTNRQGSPTSWREGTASARQGPRIRNPYGPGYLYLSLGVGAVFPVRTTGGVGGTTEATSFKGRSELGLDWGSFQAGAFVSGHGPLLNGGIQPDSFGSYTLGSGALLGDLGATAASSNIGFGLVGRGFIHVDHFDNGVPFVTASAGAGLAFQHLNFDIEQFGTGSTSSRFLATYTGALVDLRIGAGYRWQTGSIRVETGLQYQNFFSLRVREWTGEGDDRALTFETRVDGSLISVGIATMIVAEAYLGVDRGNSNPSAVGDKP